MVSCSESNESENQGSSSIINMCWACEIDVTRSPLSSLRFRSSLPAIKLPMSLARFMAGQVKHETVGSRMGGRQLQDLAAFLEEAL
jgi:hypothetical protein